MVESIIRISRADVIESIKRRKMASVVEREEKENTRALVPSIATHFKKRVIEQHSTVVRKSPRITRVSKEEIENATKEQKTFNQRLRESKSKVQELVEVTPEVQVEEKEVEVEEIPSTVTQRRGRRGNKPLKPTIAITVEPITAEPMPVESVAELVTEIKTGQSKQFSPFAEAKRAFHRSGSFKIVGRVEEKAAFSSFWYDSVAVRKGASIYISGNPGTGKTALVDEMLTELVDDDTSIKLIKLNCMMLKDPLKAFNEIAAKLDISDREANPFLTLSLLEQKLTNCEDEKF